MALRDLQAFFDDDGLEYPLPSSAFSDPGQFPQGKTYNVPSPDAKTGLWLAALADLGARAAAGLDMADGDATKLRLDDDGEKTLYQRVLGPVYEQMLTDKVKWTALQHVGQDAYLCFAMSENAADLVLAGSGEREARRNRASRRATAKKTAGGRSRRASTATATRTRKQGSPASSTSPNASEGPAAKAV